MWLADLITAVTLTDDGPNVAEQPSKLFTSRGEFQQSRAARYATDPYHIPISEVEHSVHTLLNNLPPSVASGSSPQTDPTFASCPAPKSLSLRPLNTDARRTANLHRPASHHLAPKSVRAVVQRALNIINKVEARVPEIEALITLPDDFNGGNADQVARMWTQVDIAAKHVDSAGQSLKAIRRKEPKVLERKEAVLALLKGMDHRITILGATLPSRPAETSPVYFDAGKFYSIMRFIAVSRPFQRMSTKTHSPGWTQLHK
jgi:hypothetical protein